MPSLQDQADKHLEDGQLEAAIQVYQEALARDPENPILHNNLGAAFQAKGDLDAAYASFDQALRLDRRLAVARCNQGNILATKGQNQAAMRAYGEALQIDPGLGEAWQNSGALAAEEGKKGRALIFFDRAITLRPDLLPALAARARVYFLVGRYHDALADVRTARQHAGEDAELRYLELEILLELEPEQAQYLAGEWALKAPNDHRPRLILARLLAREGRFSEALAGLEELSFSNGLPDDIALTKAGWLLAAGKIEEAEPLILHLQKEAPQDPERWLLRGRLLLAKEQAGAALIWLRKTAASPEHENRAEVYLLMSQAWRSTGDRHRALAALDTALSRNPRHRVCRQARAQLLADLDRYEESLQDLDRALKYHPGQPELLNLQGICWAALEKKEKAVQIWDQVLEAHPRFVPARVNRGQHYLLTGKVEAALMDLRIALEWQKRAPQIWRLYRDACQRSGRKAEKATAEEYLSKLGKEHQHPE